MEVVAAVIVNNKGEYFCCRRGSGRALEGYLEFPGGKTEPLESKENALKREIEEELYSKINILKFITTVEHDYTDFHITMHAYLCELLSGDLTLTEHTEKKWLSPKDMNLADFAPADRPIVEKLKNTCIL